MLPELRSPPQIPALPPLSSFVTHEYDGDNDYDDDDDDEYGEIIMSLPVPVQGFISNGTDNDEDPRFKSE